MTIVVDPRFEGEQRRCDIKVLLESSTAFTTGNFIIYHLQFLLSQLRSIILPTHRSTKEPTITWNQTPSKREYPFSFVTTSAHTHTLFQLHSIFQNIYYRQLADCDKTPSLRDESSLRRQRIRSRRHN